MKALLLLVALAGCGELACIDGRVAYRDGNVWVQSERAAKCVPVAGESK